MKCLSDRHEHDMLDMQAELEKPQAGLGKGGRLMHAAKLAGSRRLQRVRDLLSDGREYSTLEIALIAKVCAVNSIVAELRANGLEINCRQASGEGGGRVWLYRLMLPRKVAA